MTAKETSGERSVELKPHPSEQYVTRAFSQIQERFGHIEDIQDFRLHGYREFQEIWDTCFGEQGEEDEKHLIARAYVLAEYAHQHQFRKQLDGKTKQPIPYIQHVLAVTRGVAGHKQQAWVIASALGHDIFEDSHAFGHEATEEDFRAIFGRIANEKIIPTVQALSEVQRSEKEQAFVATLKQVIERGLENPAVVLIKIYDRLHNMRTISAMSRDHQERKAGETYMIYAPLAKRFGLLQEAEELAQRSIRILNSYHGGERLNERITQAIASLSSQIDSEALIKQCQQALSEYRGITVKGVAYPTFEDVYDRVSLYEYNRPQNLPLPEWCIPPDALPITLSLVIADDEFDDLRSLDTRIKWVQKRVGPFIPLALHADFQLPEIMGFGGVFQMARKGMYEGKAQLYLKLHNGIPIQIDIYTNSDYQKEHVPLSVLTSRASDPMSVALAQEKLMEIRRDYNAWMSEDTTRDDIRWFGKVLHGSFPLFIMDEGDPNTRRQLYQPNNATLADILIRRSDWWRISGIKVNDRLIDMRTDLGECPVAGAEISFRMSGEGEVLPLPHPSLADKLVVRRDQKQQIYKEIERIYREIPDHDPRKEAYRQEIINYGWHQLSAPVASRIIPFNLLHILPKTYATASEFLFDVGLGKIEEREIRTIRDQMVLYCESLHKITVFVRDIPGIDYRILGIFYSRKNSMSVPDLIHHAIDWIDGQAPILTFYFSPNDPAIENLSALKSQILTIEGVESVEIIEK
jgi:hypothetical protein